MTSPAVACQAMPTIFVGALMFLLSQCLSRCAEFIFTSSFGPFDSLLKHVTYVGVVVCLVFAATAVWGTSKRS
jgi:hypothetical protein